MKKVILCIIIAFVPYCIFLNATASRLQTNYSDLELSSLNSEVEMNWEMLRTPIRPALNPDFEALSDKERDGLRGSVKTVRTNSTSFIERNGVYKRLHTSPIYEHVFYDKDGEVYQVGGNRKSGCGNELRPLIREIYSDRGRLIAEIHFTGQSNAIQSKTTYSYDTDGKLLKVSTFDGEGLIEEQKVYKYKFDSYGNWVEQISIPSGQNLQTGDRYYGQYRKILYYPR
jgi:hypothetical protein